MREGAATNTTRDPGHFAGGDRSRREWLAIAVRVKLGEGDRDIRRMRALERWLAHNHTPRALFNPDGRPRSEVVCLAVPAGQSEKALAFRAFCGGLGLAGSLVQWRIAEGGRAGAGH